MEGVGAIGGLVGCVFEGCISMMEMEIERRPYHRNCSCALHKIKEDGLSKACSRCGKVSFPAIRSWREGCLSLTSAYHFSAQPSFSSSSSSSSSARKAMGGGVSVYGGPNSTLL